MHTGSRRKDYGHWNVFAAYFLVRYVRALMHVSDPENRKGYRENDREPY